MTILITKTWFEDGAIHSQQIQEQEIYKREFVELTKEECFDILLKHKDGWFSLLVAVQDKLKEKNNG